MMGHCASWAAPNDLLRGAARWREAPTTNWNDVRAGAAKANPVIADSVLMVGGKNALFLSFIAATLRFAIQHVRHAWSGMYSLLPKEQGF